MSHVGVNDLEPEELGQRSIEGQVGPDDGCGVLQVLLGGLGLTQVEGMM